MTTVFRARSRAARGDPYGSASPAHAQGPFPKGKARGDSFRVGHRLSVLRRWANGAVVAMCVPGLRGGAGVCAVRENSKIEIGNCGGLTVLQKQSGSRAAALQRAGYL